MNFFRIAMHATFVVHACIGSSPGAWINTTGDTYVTTQGSKEFTYNYKQSFSGLNLSAAIMMTNTATNTHWGYNLPATSDSPLEFFYKTPTHHSYFDAATDRWLIPNSKNIWEYCKIGGTADLWTSVKHQSVWLKSFPWPANDYRWEQYVVPLNTTKPPLTPATVDDYISSVTPVIKQSWQYFATTDIFKNMTLNSSWKCNLESLTWSHIDNQESWAYNPITDSFSCIAPYTEENNWRIIPTNSLCISWLEEKSKKVWHFVPSSADPTTCCWVDDISQDHYYFLPDQQIWVCENNRENRAIFPPQVPPLFAYLLNTLQIPLLPAAPGSITNYLNFINNDEYYLITPQGSTINLYNNTMLLSDGNTIQKTSTHFWQHSNGQCWKTISDWFNPAIYENNSTGIDDHIRAFRTVGEVWFYQDCDTHRWQFDPFHNWWENKLTNAIFTYNPETQTWHNHASDTTWKYQCNNNQWLWHNNKTNEDWISVKTDTNREWHNITQSSIWHSTSNGLFCVNDASQWYYNQATAQWHTNNRADSLDLFPLLPPDCAGHACALNRLRLESRIHTPYSITESEDSLTDQLKNQAQLFTSIPGSTIENSGGLRGLAKRNEYLYNSNYIFPREQTKLALMKNIYNAASSLFTKKPLLIFPEPGAGGATFEVSFLRIDFASITHYRFKLLLSNIDLNNNQPVYTIEIGPITPKSSEKNIKIIHNNRVLYEQILTDYPIVDPAMGVAGSTIPFWFVVRNGHFILGKNNPFSTINSTDGILVDYILPTQDADSLCYFGLEQYSLAQPAGFSSITPYPADLLAMIPSSIDLKNQIADTLEFSKAEEIWIRAKRELATLKTIPTTNERISKIITILELIQGNGRTRSTVTQMQTILNDHYSKKPVLKSNNSALYLECIGGSLIDTSIILEQYLRYTKSLTSLENQFTQLVVADGALLNSEARQALIETTKTNIASYTTTLAQTMSATMTQAHSAEQRAGNDDLTPFTNFFKEELQLLQSIALVLALIDPAALNRFILQDSLYAQNESTTTALITTNEEMQKTSLAMVIDQLAQTLVEKNNTLFSALTAAAIALCFNKNFDSIRRYIDSFLITQGYTDCHNPIDSNSVLNNKSEAAVILQELLNKIVPALASQENNFNPRSINIPQKPEQKITEVFLDQEFSSNNTGALIEQQKTINDGTNTYLSNTAIQTKANETTTVHVREIVLPHTEKQEAYVRLYLKDALLTLGNGNYSSNSNTALSVLGAAEITPSGNAVISLNSDLTIYGSRFLKASEDFGHTTEQSARCVPALPTALRGINELTFHAEAERTITITSGTDLDLTSFGQGQVKNGQRIIFSGNITLIFEANTRLRLPYTDPNNSGYALRLIFKDNARLIFTGAENYDGTDFNSIISGPEAVSTKILGVGDIQFNDNAQCTILRSAYVGVEADYHSNVTNINVELNNNSSWLVGNSNTLGGSFYIGNMIEGGYNNLQNAYYPNTNEHSRFGDISNPFLPRQTQVDFSLTLNDKGSSFIIGRNGFVGFGTGVIEKNTNQSERKWLVNRLYNVGNISLTVDNGTFAHYLIPANSGGDVSCLAFGPQIPRATYQLKVNKNNISGIRGGGSVFFMRDIDEPVFINFNAKSQALSGGPTDAGKQSILAPIPLIMCRKAKNTLYPETHKYGRASIIETPSSYYFTGPLDEFYLAMTMQKLALNNRYVITTTENQVLTYTAVDQTGNIISAPINVRTIQGYKKNSAAANAGFLRTTTVTARPKGFIMPALSSAEL